MRQRTIKESISTEGIGLQTGRPVRLTLRGSRADSGINFVRTDLPGDPVLNIRSLDLENNGASGFSRRTEVGRRGLRIHTTEHFLAALYGLGIDNITAELDGPELPGLDGSAKPFVELINKAGIKELEAPRKTLEIKETIRCERSDRYLEMAPADGLNISYTMSYSDPALGQQALALDINEENFVRWIAPARTFCLKREAVLLRILGFGRGANYENTLVMARSGPVKNTLRFPDEPVRHKILDLIGDLCLVGMPVAGRIRAHKSGHALNMELVKKLKKLI